MSIAFAVTAAVVVVGGLLLGFFGIGAEMAQPKTIRFTIRNRNIEPRSRARSRWATRCTRTPRAFRSVAWSG